MYSLHELMLLLSFVNSQKDKNVQVEHMLHLYFFLTCSIFQTAINSHRVNLIGDPSIFYQSSLGKSYAQGHAKTYIHL